jgi:hypothetical protein
MRPITVSVGPLAAVSSIGAPIPIGSVGTFSLNLVPTGGSNNAAWVGVGTITNGVLSISSTTSGAIAAGMRLNTTGLAPNTRVLGPGPTPGTWIVYPTQTVSPVPSIRGNQVVTLDAPRQVQIANTEAAGTNSFTVSGTDAAGNQISETLVSTGAAVTTSQNFATITQITCSAPLVATAQAATATGTTPWVMFDPYASGGAISKQCLVNGVANYTVQVSYDDPLTGAVAPGAMGWTNDTDATFVGATTSLSGSWPYTPLWARVLLNSGAGSVLATFIQPGNLGR